MLQNMVVHFTGSKNDRTVPQQRNQPLQATIQPPKIVNRPLKQLIDPSNQKINLAKMLKNAVVHWIWRKNVSRTEKWRSYGYGLYE
jgi:hypothetical protein